MSNNQIDINVDGNNNIIIHQGENIKIITPEGDKEKLKQILEDLQLTQGEIISILEEKIQSILEKQQQDLLIQLKGIIEGNNIGVNLPSWDLDCTEEDMPNKPFIGNLQSFSEKEACIYYSRTKAVLELFDKIKSTKKRHTIYLLYGQTGVGKSSFLNAGLKPRLKKELKEPIYYKELSPLGNWSWQEQDLSNYVRNKRTVLVFDQFEQIFTTSRREDVEAQTILNIATLFSHADPNQLSILFCFRKEYLADVEELFKQTNFDVSFSKKMLEPLSIGEIKHYLRVPFFRKYYNLTIKKTFIDNLATKLTLDSPTSIAPILQLTLYKLWEHCSGEDPKVFDDSLYEKHIKEGSILRNYLLEQFDKVKKVHPLWFNSGLVLCIFKYHASNQGYTKVISFDELKSKFINEKISAKDLDELIGFLSDDVKLLVRLRRQGTWSSCLMHDTLVPHINAEFKYSKQKGPRAVKVLESHQAIHGKKMTTENHLLSRKDLIIVKNGKNSMPVWTLEEEQLIKRSRAEYRRNIGLIVIILVGIIGCVGVGVWLLKDYTNKKNKAQKSLVVAREFYQTNDINNAIKNYNEVFETGFLEDSLVLDLNQIIKRFSYTYQLKHIEDYYQLLDAISKKNQIRLDDTICKETYSELAFLFFLNKSPEKVSTIFARYGDSTTINTDERFVTTFSNVFGEHHLKSLVKKYFPEMVYVEAPDAQNAYHKTIKEAYWIGKYELTFQDFLLYLNIQSTKDSATITNIIIDKKSVKITNEGTATNYPMSPIKLKWKYAYAYAQWVNGSLPNEEQWEYAAKGGILASTKDTSSLDDRAVCCGKKKPLFPLLVGTKKTNVLGLYDMIGNVDEWMINGNKKGGSHDTPPPPDSYYLEIGFTFKTSRTGLPAGVRLIISKKSPLFDFFTK